MNTIKNKNKYTSPAISCIALDNEISLILVSGDPEEPGASNQLKAPEYFSINHFPTV